jgi:uncharacterized protein (TIGR03089 family)
MTALERAAGPADLLAALVNEDATKPRLTWYDDGDGPTQGERIELSARVLATWVAKAANLLTEELDVERGDVVTLDLPAHWRTVYWAIALWRVGAVLTLDEDPAAAVIVTDRPRADVAAQQVAVSLPALARVWTPTTGGQSWLPGGVVDEAADLSSHGDVFEPVDPPGRDDPALRGPNSEWTAAQLLAGARDLAAVQGWHAGERVAVDATDPGDALAAVVAAWSTGGSVVLTRQAEHPDAAKVLARSQTERVTSAYAPPGRPASRS